MSQGEIRRPGADHPIRITPMRGRSGGVAIKGLLAFHPHAVDAISVG